MARSPRLQSRATTGGRHRPETVHLDAVRLEGGILSSAMLAAVVAREAGSQADVDYGVPKGLLLKDEVARYFQMGRSMHASFSEAVTPSLEATVAHVAAVMRDVFQFHDVVTTPPREVRDRRFALSLEAQKGAVPVVVATPAEGIEAASQRLATHGRRTSAASTIQDYLDASPNATWGLATDGHVFRIMRDNASLTRPAFVDVDLGRMFETESLGEFVAAWLLLHASRFRAAQAGKGECPFDAWRTASQKRGEVARDRLRAGVEAALVSLGTGFLEHSANDALRKEVAGRPAAVQTLYGECLQVVYRMIFLFAAEDRDLLHAPNTDPAARALYVDGYSMSSLRARATRRTSYEAHHDLWDGVTIVFDALAGGDEGAAALAAKLGLPVLDGLFSERRLVMTEGACISNSRLMSAVRKLAWLEGPSGLTPVNWRDMETEELGSVYESLLELAPVLKDGGRGMGFAVGDETKGNQRKTTGSYYTPDSLVQSLLDSALDPVLDRAENESSDPEKGLRALRVIDSACGSGHFLLAAARRIASRLSRVRGGGVADRLAFRHAMRDVVKDCIHGVDRNPMAVDLAKVALWIETVDPGKPLGFLDANLHCGDALLGVYNTDMLRKCVPPAAYRPLTGDDKKITRDLERRNNSQIDEQGELGLLGEESALPPLLVLPEAAAKLRRMPEETFEDVAARRRVFERDFAPGNSPMKTACDVYVAAFLCLKVPYDERDPTAARAPTTNDVALVLNGSEVNKDVLARWTELANEARAFHWFLAYPDVLDDGGFDCVIGNPPWERVKLQEQEFFASRDPDIASAPNAAARGQMIKHLAEAEAGSQKRLLHEAYERAKRSAEAASVFARTPGKDGGRFPLTGRGDVNTYALFAEHFAKLVGEHGRAGIIVPTGIATDATTAPFFGALVTEGRLVRLVDFENRESIFPAVHKSYKFCQLTIGRNAKATQFACYLTSPEQIQSAERQFTLTSDQISRINPNTKTAPMFRSIADAVLVNKIYSGNKVLVDKLHNANPWKIKLRTMFHVTNGHKDGTLRSSNSISNFDVCDWAPVHEGDYGYQYDHRYATYDNGQVVVCSNEQKQAGLPIQYGTYALKSAFEAITNNWGISKSADPFIAFRRVSGANNERTIIASALPYMPLTYGWIVLCADSFMSKALLLANMNSLVFDYCLRQSLSQPSIPQNTFEQTPVIPPHRYTREDIAYILPRVVELTCTSACLASFAVRLGFGQKIYEWDLDRRAQLRADIDARYARLYGLSRDDLRFLLDPSDVHGLEYPSETFRVLKEKENKAYGMFRTRNLVLRSWDENEAEQRMVAQ